MPKKLFSYPAVVHSVVDGDTVRLDILLSPIAALLQSAPDVDLGFNIRARRDGIWLAGQTVRLNRCNAPEKNTEPGQRAAAVLRDILPVGQRVRLTSHGRDKYGRVLADLSVGTPPLDVAAEMVRTGLAVFWDGKGPRPLPAARGVAASDPDALNEPPLDEGRLFAVVAGGLVIFTLFCAAAAVVLRGLLP